MHAWVHHKLPAEKLLNSTCSSVHLNCFRVYSNVFCRVFVALNASIMLMFKHHNIMEVSSRCSQFILVNGTWRADGFSQDAECISALPQAMKRKSLELWKREGFLVVCMSDSLSQLSSFQHAPNPTPFNRNVVQHYKFGLRYATHDKQNWFKSKLHLLISLCSNNKKWFSVPPKIFS